MRRAPLVVACTAAGCVAGSPLPEHPARIVAATPLSRAALQEAVSEALATGEVMLADDALSDSSWLIVARRPRGSLRNPPLSGRDLGEPERFRLFVSGERCVLVHERSGRRFELSGTECIAE